MGKLAVLFLFVTSALWAEAPCPVIDFIVAREVSVLSGNVVNAPLRRESDLSYTMYPHNYSPPFRRFPGVPNYQDTFTACLPAAKTTSAPIVINGPDPGAGSVYTAAFGNVGNGSSAAAWYAFNGTAVEVYRGDSQAIYQSKTNYTLAGERSGLLPGDFNGDNKADLAIVGWNTPANDGFVAVLTSNGDGTYNQAVKSPAGSTYTVLMTSSDYDRDGKLDLVTGSNDGLAFLRGKGDGTFEAPVAITNTGFGALTSADMNGDGKQDLLAGSGAQMFFYQGNGNGTFGTAKTSPVASNPLYISTGDFNKDGRLDAAVSGFSGASIALGLGDGTFSPPRHYLFGHDPRSMVLADINRDGNLDLISGEGSANLLIPVVDTGHMAVLLGNGDGTFIGAPLYLGSNRDFDAADFNGDSKTDFVAAGFNTLEIKLASNGEFVPGVTLSGGETVLTGDFNSDGKQDIASASGAKVQVHFGNGDGTFQAAIQFATPSTLVKIAKGDFNADGKTDLAAAYAGNQAGVLVLLQNASNALTVSAQYPTGGVPTDVAAADVNADGRPDLIVTDAGQFGSQSVIGGLRILYSNPNGTFQNAVSLAVGQHPKAISTGDLNGDGKTDLVVTTEGPNFGDFIAVILVTGNTLGTPNLIRTDFGPQSPIVADFNGDGKRDIFVPHCCGDVTNTFMVGNGDGTFGTEQFFPTGGDLTSGRVADFNGDGKPDIGALSSNGGIAILINNSKPRSFVTVSAATYIDGPVAPESIATAFGVGLANGFVENQAAVPPTTLGGVSIKVRDSAGISRDAGIYLVSQGQVNFVIPTGTLPGRATVTIQGPTTQNAEVLVSRVAPGIFALNASGLAAARLIRVNGAVQTSDDVFAVVNGQVVAKPIVFGAASEQLFLELYGTGIRNRTLLSDVKVQVGPMNITAVYAGAQGTVGLDQVNISLNRNLLQGKGVVDVILAVEDKTSPTLKLTFQ